MKKKFDVNTYFARHTFKAWLSTILSLILVSIIITVQHNTDWVVLQSGYQITLLGGIIITGSFGIFTSLAAWPVQRTFARKALARVADGEPFKPFYFMALFVATHWLIAAIFIAVASPGIVRHLYITANLPIRLAMWPFQLPTGILLALTINRELKHGAKLQPTKQ